jgi:hypothetical protein
MRFILDKRSKTAFRILHWTLVIYLFIAVLHGAAPGIWRHHVEQGDRTGPFRLLLFTELLLAAPAIIPLISKKYLLSPARSISILVRPVHLNLWTLRGPPSL